MGAYGTQPTSLWDASSDLVDAVPFTVGLEVLEVIYQSIPSPGESLAEWQRGGRHGSFQIP
jgi:hypothetical protein